MFIKRINKNNRGQVTWLIMLVLVFVFIALIGLLVLGVVVGKINSTLDQDIDLGAVNLADVNAQTFGYYNLIFVKHADWLGLSVIFGLILGLFLSSYFARNRFPKWGIILDIVIIFAMFILSMYLKSTYQTLMDVLASVDITFLEDNIPKSSIFMLNLPIFTAIIGVVMMILFHSSIPKKEEESMQGGYLPSPY